MVEIETLAVSENTLPRIQFRRKENINVSGLKSSAGDRKWNSDQGNDVYRTDAQMEFAARRDATRTIWNLPRPRRRPWKWNCGKQNGKEWKINGEVIFLTELVDLTMSLSGDTNRNEKDDSSARENSPAWDGENDAEGEKKKVCSAANSISAVVPYYVVIFITFHLTGYNTAGKINYAYYSVNDRNENFLRRCRSRRKVRGEKNNKLPRTTLTCE